MVAKKITTEQRIKETILYLLGQHPMSTEQLNWMLFQIDMQWYGHTGEPFFAGVTWIKTEKGVDFRIEKYKKTRQEVTHLPKPNTGEVVTKGG